MKWRMQNGHDGAPVKRHDGAPVNIRGRTLVDTKLLQKHRCLFAMQKVQVVPFGYREFN